MSQAISTAEKNEVQSVSNALSLKTCNKCGGNGYMKTTPNCYHTCLTCLGKGLVSQNKDQD